ncbi:MAG: GNAT family N-acetyltransferase, partial [Desulfomonilaceae bacterium]|nr:GNAT family N-acetyltransferase [Desulfomonilaceae bacterium]
MKCFDKEGRPFEVEEQRLDCLSDLMQMYEKFSPRAISQGLPPARDVDLNRWVRGLLDSGWNFVCRQDGLVVGHAAVLPDLDKSDGEYVV